MKEMNQSTKAATGERIPARIEETAPYLAAEIQLIKDLDALVSLSRARGHMIPTRGVRRAIEAARAQGLHNLADEATKLVEAAQ